MPTYAPKLPATRLGEMIQKLAKKLPHKEFYLPDPYDPSSYLMPIGGIIKRTAKRVAKKAATKVIKTTEEKLMDRIFGKLSGGVPPPTRKR